MGLGLARAEFAVEVETKLIGRIDVTANALPLLRRADRATLVHVGSGLGLVPLASAPVYSATRAAVHSLNVSLRHQLASTGIRVVEILPPAVETELHRHQPGRPPKTMALEPFLDACMKGRDSGRPEIAIGLARGPRVGARLAPHRFHAIVNRAA